MSDEVMVVVVVSAYSHRGQHQLKGTRTIEGPGPIHRGNLTFKVLYSLISICSGSVCRHSHKSPAALQVAAEELAGSPSSKGHRSTTDPQTPHQIPLLPVSSGCYRFSTRFWFTSGNPSSFLLYQCRRGDPSLGGTKNKIRTSLRSCNTSPGLFIRVVGIYQVNLFGTAF